MYALATANIADFATLREALAKACHLPNETQVTVRGQRIGTVYSGTLHIPAEFVMRRWPRLTAHLICFSLGYCSPSGAANIIADYRTGQPNACEWIWTCYRCDPAPAVRGAIRMRHTHRGYMAHYPHAIQLVRRAITTGDEPPFGSWF